MRDLPHIHSVYLEVDAEFETKRSAAVGDAHAIGRIDANQRLNDQAYFVLCWGQLETAIDDTCRAAIRNRQTSGNWSIRRGWDFYNPDDKRLSGLKFDERTAFVLDKAAGSGSAWARVMQYYSLRNQIAHGNLLAQRIDVDAVVSEFFQIQTQLQT